VRTQRVAEVCELLPVRNVEIGRPQADSRT